MFMKASPSSITLLPSVLERIPVLLFVGDQDYICNYMGIEKMMDAMTWSGEKGLGVSPLFHLRLPLLLYQLELAVDISCV